MTQQSRHWTFVLRKLYSLKRYTRPCVHRSTIYNRQGMEVT